MADVFLDAQIDVAVTVNNSELNRVHLLTSTIAPAITVGPAALTRVYLITATIAPAITVGPVTVTRVHLLTSTVPLGVDVLGQLFYAPAVDPPPAGFDPMIPKATMAMPTPTLDSMGRPLQPWVPA